MYFLSTLRLETFLRNSIPTTNNNCILLTRVLSSPDPLCAGVLANRAAAGADFVGNIEFGRILQPGDHYKTKF